MLSKTAITLYLAVQSLSVLGWWIALHLYPDLIPLFRSNASSDAALLDLWLADLTLVGGGSAVASFLIAQGHATRIPAIWMLVGAVLYATLLPLGASLRSGGGWLAVVLMLGAAIMTVICATTETRR